MAMVVENNQVQSSDTTENASDNATNNDNNNNDSTPRDGIVVDNKNESPEQKPENMTESDIKTESSKEEYNPEAHQEYDPQDMQNVKQEYMSEEDKTNQLELYQPDEGQDSELVSAQSHDCNDSNATHEDQADEKEKTNLIVNYLPQQMSDEEFQNLFKQYGTMKSCKIVRNRVTGYSYGFGFVDYESHEEALKAIEGLNGHELNTKKIKVAFARPAGQDIKQANLYIKNVPNDWTQDKVKEIFDPYGKIIQVRVLGNNRGVAFVLYDLRKQAEDALEALNGKQFDGCETPLEIKFAADKKSEKGNKSSGNNQNKSGSNSNNQNSGNNNNNNNNNTGGSDRTGRRERGHRGGRNRNRNRNNNNNNMNNNINNNNNNNNNNHNNNQGSFFDRQRNNRGGQGQYNSNNYNSGGGGGGGGYSGNYNDSNGFGPMRHQPGVRTQRYAPFVPMQQPLGPAITTQGPMASQMAPNPSYGFPAQQQMIPFGMMPTQQMTTMQPVGQPAHQMAQNPMASMYGATTQLSQMGFTPMAQNAMNMYSVASNNLNNAANMQPQIGQPMTIRGNMMDPRNAGMLANVGAISGGGGLGGGGGIPGGGGGNAGGNSSGGDDGVTLFVYNIGPDSDEKELKGLFGPYGYVTKCNVVRKTPGGETKGFGFVTLKDRDQANAAIAGLNGSMRNGRALQVSMKK